MLKKLKITPLVHYTAWFAALFASVFYTVFLFMDGTYYLTEGKFGVIPLMLLIAIAVGGFVLYLFKRKAGPKIMIVGGVLLIIYMLIAGGFTEFTLAFMYGLPFIIPGILLHYFPRAYL